MAQVVAVVNEEQSGSDEESDDDPGIKSAYSVEDLLDVLDSDNGVLDSGFNPDTETCFADITQSETSNILEPSVSDNDHVNVVSEDPNNIISSHKSEQHVTVIHEQECSELAGSANVSYLNSKEADELAHSHSVHNGEDAGSDKKISSDNSVSMTKDDGRTYDEVYVEGLYQNPDEGEASKTSHCEDDANLDLYENVENGDGHQDEQEDDGWGSSEFEEYDDYVSGDQQSVGEAKSCNSQDSIENDQHSFVNGRKGNRKQFASGATKRLGLHRISWRKPSSDVSQSSITPSTVFDKLTSRLSNPRTKSHDMDDEEDCENHLQMIEVALNMSKHPPAELPPPPSTLTPLQEKRRHVIMTIVNSENSYTASLRRIIEDFEKPLLDAKLHLISRHSVCKIFHKVRDILQCHNMFGIELAEAVKAWDVEEKIGNVFTASFSKSIVFEIYSSFVNNFSLATETVRKQARCKPAFAEFLKQKISASEDRLSLFGLLVKPVQRFPQFIMLLQDLLKLTPRDHSDRLALQIALTELDTLTYRLNETKRDSENRLDVKRLLSRVGGRHSVKFSPAKTHLIRHDNFTRIKYKNGEAKHKVCRLFLLSDQLLCTSIIIKESETRTEERFTFVWNVPIRDIKVHDQALPSTFRASTNKSTSVSQKSGPLKPNVPLPMPPPSENNPYKKELDDMLHDLNVLEQINDLAGQLRLRYEGFSIDALNGVNSSLQLMIRQKCDIDRCLLTLSFPTRGSAAEKYTFQTATPALKHEWLLELHNAKLALEPYNHPAWNIPESEQSIIKMPILMQAILLENTTGDSAKKQAKSKKKSSDTFQAPYCVATRVMLPSHDLPTGFGVQHLWVCESNISSLLSRISVVSLHTNKPCIIESFPLNDSGKISAVESVPGWSTGSSDKYAFKEDTVWMAAEDKIFIYKVVEEDRSSKKRVIKVDSKVSCLKYQDGQMYVGTKTGLVFIYSRDPDGAWKVKSREKVVLGEDTVACLLPVNGDMWAACECSVHVISTSTNASKLTVAKSQHELCKDTHQGHIEYMVKAGVGVMMTLKGHAVVKLYHLETFEHLQDISVASAITRMLQDQEVNKETMEAVRAIQITCLMSESGWLWIGTSAGFILTVPLPRLEGVPQVKGRPNVSYHGHTGPVQFLSAVHCCTTPIQSPPLDGRAPSENCISQGQSNSACPTLSVGLLADWQLRISSPDLISFQNAPEEDKETDVCSLYDSLLMGLDADENSYDSSSEGVFRKGTPHGSIVRRGVAFQRNVTAMSIRLKKHLTHAVMKTHSLPDDANCSTLTQHTNDDTLVSADVEVDDFDSSSVDDFAGVTSEVSCLDTSTSVTAGFRRTTVPLCSSMVASNLVHVPSNKSLVIVSGGDGYAGWSEHKYTNQLRDGTSLLLWKC